MVDVIENEVVLTQNYLGKSRLSERVIAAMREVPRHKFVPRHAQSYAYDNSPLYIGQGQTISQPYIVAIMTDLIEPGPDDVILDVGTGSGYQAAIVSRLCKMVYSIDRITELTQSAQQLFTDLGYTNIVVKAGDGSKGWIEHAPYDGIIVAATAPYIPNDLVAQLKVGGKMIIPVEQSTYSQELLLIEKRDEDNIDVKDILPVAFVPLICEHSNDEKDVSQ